eukprot:GHVQ01008684.1.p1 GENE.GHVQ01008684.1~~GHVQ01008684.1.p1  ORF type:complete len:934 (-),score=97.85 GHVQ01008684.1:1391-4192(-)
MASPVLEPLLLIIVTVLAAVFLQWLVSKIPAFPPPISVVWFVFGMVMGIIAEKTSFGDLEQTISNVGRIDSAVVYYVLLPILLYEATQNINWHKFKRFLVGGLSVAFGGVAFQVGLLGVLFQYTFMADTEPNQSWHKSFLLASALSSTDPVAVLSVLNNLNAPDKLCSMFDGESLINDGSSVLLFQLFFTLVQGSAETPASAIFLFVKLLFLGPLFGVALGVFMYAWLNFFRGHHLCQVIATVATCYLGFIVAEIYFNLSGPLTAVCYGLFIKAYGHIALDREAQQKHHNLVDGVSLFCNILIFVVSGVVTIRMMGVKFIGGSWNAWWQVFVMYVYLNVVRAIMILFFSPVLRWTGYGVDLREAVLLIWGGLRGALVLALGLRIEESATISKRFGETSTFFISCNVFLILLINGVTFEFLYKFLNPYPPKPFRRVYLEKVMKMIDCQYLEEKDFLMKHWLFAETDAIKHADKVVPILGWRKLDKRGKLSIKAPNISEAFRDISDESMGRWNQFLSGPDETDITSGEDDPTIAYQSSNRPTAIAIDQASGDRPLHFDPKYNLRLLERATTNLTEPPVNLSEVSGQLPCNDTAAEDSCRMEQKSPTTLCKAFAAYANDPAVTKLHMGSKHRGSAAPTKQETSEAAANSHALDVECADRKSIWNDFASHQQTLDRWVGRDESGDNGGGRAGRYDTDTTLVFDSSRNLHKLFDSNNRVPKPPLSYGFGRRSRRKTRTLGKAFGMTLPPILGGGTRTFGTEEDVAESCDTRPVDVLVADKRQSDPDCIKTSNLRLPGGDTESALRKSHTDVIARTMSESELPYSKASSPTNHRIIRSSSLAESAVSLSSLDSLEVAQRCESDSDAPAKEKRKIIRKEREGELFIMIFNACRQMYEKLYDTHCIGGSALLSLKYSLDISCDFAIGKLRQDPIKVCSAYG